MSELKHQLMLNKERSWVPCYLKSEADKVIAEKEAQILDLIGQVQKERSAKVDYKISANDLSNGLKEMYEKIDHQKYKRCLAMARMCEAEAQKCLTQQGALIGFSETDRSQYLQWHFTHFSRWHRIWLKLAKKFKEAK